MNKCVNINHPEFKELLSQSELDPISLAADISIWQDKNDTDLFPTLEQLVPPVEKVEYRFAAVDKILAKLPILNKWWKDKGISKDTFWKKFKELGIPQEQVEMYKESEGDTFEEVIIDTLAKYSFDVEVRRGKVREVKDSEIEDDYIYDEEAGFGRARQVATGRIVDSKTYSDLTVPGGTNYEENEIKTPQITPSIKGHASFSTDQGVGWFRSDELAKESLTESREYWNPYTEETEISEESWSEGKTGIRRILELQSDLFQKGKAEKYLVNTDDKGEIVFSSPYAYYTLTGNRVIVNHENGYNESFSYSEIGGREDEQLIRDKIEEYKRESKLNKKENKFLQLLNKDGNWVKFFVQSIVADSVKRGFTNVLFPAGETAAKIEGHETLATELNRINTRIEKLQKEKEVPESARDFDVIEDEYGNPVDTTTRTDNEINLEIQSWENRKQELKSQGIEKLKPIEGFYEVRVQNTLKKLYPDNVVRITDEFGNDWFSINLKDERTNQVFFQKDKTPDNKVSPDKLKSLLERTGFSLVTLSEYEATTGKKFDVNALVDMSARLVAMSDGASTDALTEEIAHMAVAQSRGTKEYNFAMELIDQNDEFEQYYDEYMAIYNDDLHTREEILGKILKKDLEAKLGTSIGMWLRRLWNKFLSMFRNKKLKDYVAHITDQFVANPDVTAFKPLDLNASKGFQSLQGDGVFFQLKEEEKTLQAQVNKLNRRYKDLAKRKKSNPSLLPQIKALEEELEGTKNGVGIYKFLQLLNEDTKNATEFLKSYFTVTEKDGRTYLGSRTDKETPGDNMIMQLAQYIGYYLPFLKELNMVLDEDAVIGDGRKKVLDKMIRGQVENFEVINRAYNQFLKETNRENTTTDQLEIAGEEIIPMDELREAPRDSNFLETWFGLARNNSDTLVRLAHRLIFDIKNRIRRAVVNWSDNFLAQSIDYIGKDMSWVAERVTVTDKDGKSKVQKSGNFISEVMQGQWDLAREKFHTDLHDKYGFSQDFSERLKEKKIIQSYNPKTKDKFQLQEIQRLKDYNQEIAKWYTKNTIPNPRMDEVIEERRTSLTPEQFEFWKLRNMETNKDGSVKYYKGELVVPSRGSIKSIQYGDTVEQVQTTDWTNKEYFKLSEKDRAFLDFLKQQKKEMDKAVPFANFNRLPQMYESTLDIMRLNEPEVFKRLKRNIASSIIREEDDTQFNDTPKLNDGTILDDVPIRFTSLLAEPDRVTTDILSSLIAYKQMQENYVQMSRELPKFENMLQGSKRRIVKTGNKVIEDK